MQKRFRQQLLRRHKPVTRAGVEGVQQVPHESPSRSPVSKETYGETLDLHTIPPSLSVLLGTPAAKYLIVTSFRHLPYY